MISMPGVWHFELVVYNGEKSIAIEVPRDQFFKYAAIRRDTPFTLWKSGNASATLTRRRGVFTK